MVGIYSTEAFSAARLTDTFNTPYSSFSARSTAPTQAAQVIPLTAKSILTDATPYPSPLTVSIMTDKGTGFLGSENSIVAFSAEKFTAAFFTPLYALQTLFHCGAAGSTGHACDWQVYLIFNIHQNFTFGASRSVVGVSKYFASPTPAIAEINLPAKLLR